MNHNEILFRSSKVKIRKNSNDKAILSWDCHDAKSITLEVPSIGILSLSSQGQYTVMPSSTATYTLKAIYTDGEEQIKHLTIEVLNEANASFDIKEQYDGQNVYAELVWNIRNATSVSINEEDVPSCGFRKYLITGIKKIDVSYVDAFGTKTKTFHIQKNSSVPQYFKDSLILLGLHTYKWIINILYMILKLCTRLFVPWGKVGKLEYGITSWAGFLCLTYVIANCIMSNWHNLDNHSLYDSYLFKESYLQLSGLTYILIMLYSKNSKQDSFDWILNLGIIIYPLLTYYFNVSETWKFFVFSFFPYAFLMLVFLFEILFDGNATSNFNFYKEFFTDYKVKYKRKESKRILIW